MILIGLFQLEIFILSFSDNFTERLVCDNAEEGRDRKACLQSLSHFLTLGQPCRCLICIFHSYSPGDLAGLKTILELLQVSPKQQHVLPQSFPVSH